MPRLQQVRLAHIDREFLFPIGWYPAGPLVGDWRLFWIPRLNLLAATDTVVPSGLAKVLLFVTAAPVLAKKGHCRISFSEL